LGSVISDRRWTPALLWPSELRYYVNILSCIHLVLKARIFSTLFFTSSNPIVDLLLAKQRFIRLLRFSTSLRIASHPTPFLAIKRSVFFLLFELSFLFNEAFLSFVSRWPIRLTFPKTLAFW
jgi:hypothetical protein